MPSLGAEMRYVDHGDRIGRHHPHHLTGRKPQQRLAQAQNGKRADQPAGINLDYRVHAAVLTANAGAVQSPAHPRNRLRFGRKTV